MHAHEARLSDCDQWIEDAGEKYSAKRKEDRQSVFTDEGGEIIVIEFDEFDEDEDEANYDYERRSTHNKFRPLKGGPTFCEVDLRECTAERFDLRSRCFVFGM